MEKVRPKTLALKLEDRANKAGLPPNFCSINSDFLKERDFSTQALQKVQNWLTKSKDNPQCMLYLAGIGGSCKTSLAAILLLQATELFEKVRYYRLPELSDIYSIRFQGARSFTHNLRGYAFVVLDDIGPEFYNAEKETLLRFLRIRADFGYTVLCSRLFLNEITSEVSPYTASLLKDYCYEVECIAGKSLSPAERL